MVSLKVVYQIILILWFGSLIWIFSNISDLGYREPAPAESLNFDFAGANEQHYQDDGPTDLKTEEAITESNNDFDESENNVKTKGEIPAETLQCPLPEPSRTHPFCQENVVRLWDHGDHRCFKKFGVDKRDDCSVLSYLSEVERWCPLLPGKNRSIETETRPAKAKLREDVKGVFKILKHSYYKWMRNRISSWWPEWTKAVRAIKTKYKHRSRMRKKIFVFLGAFAKVPTFFFAASSGGALGELVQWTDLIASIYVLGHDITVSASKETLSDFLEMPDESGCIPENVLRSSLNYDLIFTDIVGVGIIKNMTGPLYSRYKCRLRVVDSFGTDAQFNYHGYKKVIPGGLSTWGKLDLDLRQFMTMFPHSPDNSFLGFVSGVKVNSTESARIKRKKRNQCLVYGKILEYWRGKANYLKIVRKYFEVHATTVNQNIVDKKREKVKLPGFVVNHGIVSHDVLMNLLQQSKVFVGLGFPYEGPAPLEAIANGAIFLNPKFDPPKNRLNSKFFKGKPTARSLTSQSPYLEEFVGKPYVYTINIGNLTEVEESLKEIMKTKISPFLPLEYTCEGMLERVDALVANQDFCEGKLWPPLNKLRIVLGIPGQSCKRACANHGLICEPAYWEVINQKAFLKKLRKCQSYESKGVLYAPSFNSERSVCYLQENVMLFSCVAMQPSQQRLCPCREYSKEQVALCKSCF